MQEIADYKIIHQLGEGSQGQYWLAEAPPRLGIADPQVAIKTIIHAASDAEFDRLAEHLRIYSSVRSPYLHEIFDIGQQGSVVYLAGRFETGGTLTRPARPSSRVDVLRAVAGAARGAHALHEVGIPHRSIRPGNIVLGDDRSRLSDVGISQLLSPGQTVTGAAQMGAIDYLAPEVVQGQPASRATDIWALGATLHKTLTGFSIFPDLPSGSLVDALRFLLTEQPVMGDALRNGERRIIESTVKPDPADRPSTALEVAEAIEDEANRQQGGPRQ